MEKDNKSDRNSVDSQGGDESSGQGTVPHIRHTDELRMLRESEERYRRFFEQSTEGIWRCEFHVPIPTDSPVDDLVKAILKHGYLAECNDAMARQYGLTCSDELIGTLLLDLWIAGDAANLEAVRSFVKNGFRLNSVETHELAADGTERYFSNNFFGETDGGLLLRVWGTQRDITKKKEAEKAAALLASIVESSEDAVVSKTLDGIVTSWNAGAERMFGYTAEEMIGRPIMAIIPKDRADEEAEILSTIRSGKNLSHYETVRVRKDGTEIEISVTVSPIRNANGEITGASKIARDISDEKRVERALRESEMIRSMAIQSGKMGIWEHDRETDHVKWSVELEEMFGLEPGGFPGTLADFYILVHVDDREKLREEVARAITEHRPYTIDFRFYHRDGSVRWMEGRGEAVYGKDGKAVRLYGVCIDVTDRRLRQHQKEFLLALSDALRPLSDPVEIQAQATRTAMEYFEADRCFYSEIIDENSVIRRDASREGFQSVAGTYPLDDLPAVKAAVSAGVPFVVRDARNSDQLDEVFRELCLELKILSFVDVPIVKEGRTVGVFCIAQGTPRDWTQFETVLAEETADRVWATIERARAEEALQINQERMRAQKEALQSAIKGSSLAASLDVLARLVKEETDGEARTAFYIADPNGEKLSPVYGAGDMAESYLREVDGFRIGEDSVACGLAVPMGLPIITPDVRKEPRWASLIELPEKYNVRACWSFPIETRENKWVGTFAMYFRTPREPLPREIELAEIVAQTAGVIINSHIEAENRERAEQSMRSSEERYRTIFESIDEGFCTVRMIFDNAGQPVDYEFLELNPSFERQTGLLDAKGKRIRDILPDHEQYWFDIYGRIARTGDPERFVSEARALGRWYDVYAFRIGMPDEKKVGILFSDVTERKRTEMFVRTMNEIYEIIRTTEVPSELLSKVARSVGTLLSAQRCVFNEVDEDQLLEVPHRDYVRTGTAAGTHKLSEYSTESTALMASGKTVVNEDTKTHPRTVEVYDGTYGPAGERAYIAVPMMREGRWVASFRVSDDVPRKWAKEEVVFVEAVAERTWIAVEKMRIDAALRESQANLEQLLRSAEEARAEAEAANRMKDEFLSILSHELRTPLNSMLGWIRMLRSESLDAELTERALEVIERNTRLQNGLIEDLLDVSRIISGKMKIEREPTDLSKVAKAAVESFGPMVETSTLELTYSAPDVEIPIHGDPLRLQQMIANLVQNAIKFTPKGGRVSVLLQPLGDHVKITVSDTGVGISPDFLPYIFDRFRQADASARRSFSGLGLGLTLVSTIVHLHGGSIRAESGGENQGSKFTILLPLLNGNADAAASMPLAEPDVNLLSGIHILLVDDDQDSLIPIARFLEKQNASVTTAASAKEALEKLGTEKIDLLISDLGMPEMDGHELLERMTEYRTPKGKQIPAIAMTAYVSEDDRQRALAAGFSAHISKPVELDVLMRAIKRVRRRSRSKT